MAKFKQDNQMKFQNMAIFAQTIALDPQKHFATRRVSNQEKKHSHLIGNM